MIFKRRDPRSWARATVEFFFPRGGWRRASSYIYHRLRRLPDSPDRIARGVFAGTLASFMPFFGFHFVTAALIAWAMRANILAALISTFVGNPFTFPLIAASALTMGGWILGVEVDMTVGEVMTDVGRAFMQIWKNFTALLTGGEMHWANLHKFFNHVFWPYTIGGILPGIATGTVLYYVSLPIIRGYQKRRDEKAQERVEKRQAAKLRAMAKAAAADMADLGLAEDPGPDPADPKTLLAKAARGMGEGMTKAVSKALAKPRKESGD